MSPTDANGIAFPVEDGGPAFPAAREESVFVEELDRYINRPVSGMSLRDYFAGQALAGMCANSRLVPRQPDGPERATGAADIIANTAYIIADALLKARTT